MSETVEQILYEHDIDIKDCRDHSVETVEITRYLPLTLPT